MSEDSPLIPASQVGLLQKQNASKGRWQMFLVLLVCAAPVIASYFTFYVIKPTGGKTNYGQLVFPVEPAPQNFLMPHVFGKWTLLLARPSENCETDEEHCLKILYLLRQVRASLGKEKQRLQIVWIVSDAKPVSEKIHQAYDAEIAGVKMIPAPLKGSEQDQLTAWLNKDNKGDAISLLDPNGARMMVFPVDATHPEFSKMRKDVEKLLKWNPTGKVGS